MICSKCAIDKNDEEFPWKNKSKNIKHTKCKMCTNGTSKDHYENNKQIYIDRNSKRRDDVRLKIQAIYCEYLSEHPCVDCNNADIIVLEPDHLFDKKFNISYMMKAGFCWDNILKELGKCDIVCRNCHAKRTHKRCNSYRVTFKRIFEYIDQNMSP